jgi:hypothetical protein
MPRHGFLLDPGIWYAEGIFLDAKGTLLPARGEMRIRHAPGCWHHHSRMEVDEGRARTFENRYEIAPLAPGAAATPWRAFNVRFGAILGRFVLVEDVILSSSSSEDGRYQGGETLQLLDDGRYLNWGWLALGAEIVSRWRLQLERVADRQ